jgi:hypothetical protein
VNLFPSGGSYARVASLVTASVVAASAIIAQMNILMAAMVGDVAFFTTNESAS